MEYQGIGTNLLTDSIVITTMSNQLIGTWHINTIHVREANLRGSRDDVDFLRPRITSHLNDLL
ncbi:Uncharacterised protein [Vibrio cholerae]|nr:Uncharacterised protein [Vibrio cholerae]